MPTAAGQVRGSSQTEQFNFAYVCIYISLYMNVYIYMYVCIYTPQGFDLSTWYVSHILVSYCDAILSDVAGWRYTARINVEIKR